MADLRNIWRSCKEQCKKFESHATTNDDATFSVEDLKLESQEQVLKYQFYNLIEEWSELDKQHFVENNGAKLKTSRVQHPLRIPQDFNYLNIDLAQSLASTVREEQCCPQDAIINPKPTYTNNLINLFKSIPSGNSVPNESVNTLKTPSLFDDRDFKDAFLKFFREEKAMPTNNNLDGGTAHSQTEAGSRPFVAPNTISSSLLDGELVITILVQARRKDNKVKNLIKAQQLIRVLGSQSVRQLVEVIDCAHKKRKARSNPDDPDSFAFIDGVFYVDAKRPRHRMEPANTSDRGALPSHSCPLAHKVKDWVQTNRPDLAAVRHKPAYSAGGSGSSCDIASSDNNGSSSSSDNSGGCGSGGGGSSSSSSSSNSNTDSTGSSNGHSCSGISEILSMDDKRCDQVFRSVGSRHLYLHESSCEHVFHVADIRMFHPNCDPANTSNFPHDVFRMRSIRRSCDVCDKINAKFIVYGDRLAPFSPCFYCEHCYYMLHYTDDGRLWYSDFTVFPYVHDM